MRRLADSSALVRASIKTAFRIDLLILLLALTMALGTGCVKTWGAPSGIDEYDAESNAEAMEDEEEEDAWEDVNR